MSEDQVDKVISRKARTLIRQIESKGFIRVARIWFDTALIAILAQLYGFRASWHPSTSARPYRLTVAEIVNALNPKTVCEVGCGLGQIMCLIRADERYGYDIDEGVVRAAKLVRGRKIHFVRGSLASVTLTHIDVLILVNWIHEVSPADLEEQLLPLLTRTRYLVLDAIDADEPSGYRYKHDFAFLESKAVRLSITRPPDEGRSFHLFEVLK